MAAYRKLIAAIIGALLMIANARWGVDLTGLEPELTAAIVGALTAAGVWAVPNRTPPV